MNMKPIYDEIWKLAKPYLNTRSNDIHTEISIRYAVMLLEKEGGNEEIVIPAIMLHDVGWKGVPESEHHKGFGPEIQSPSVQKKHELEGVTISRRILQQVNYDKEKADKILQIIEGHDTRKDALCHSDSIVKDADKLWRFSREGFAIDCERFGLEPTERAKKKDLDIDAIFFTESAKEIARKEIEQRLMEAIYSKEGPETLGEP